ncbi:uncharacterized protein LOC127137254 [Lathyrus oleraceus]|uniref:uncharacterized protein LOC127137254 n=1 Tax=Pisum sativum TaxID=3888 RepID=UPI0021D2B63B|nr:uncharacterized protein LOC127137254 [Pisum sativum]
MDHMEPENQEVKEEVTSLATLMESVIAAHNQLSPTPATPPLSAPNEFTKMVNMRMHLEEGDREGHLSKEEASTSKKYAGGFSKKKERETNAVTIERQRRPHERKNSISRQHHQVSSVILVFTNNPIQIVLVQQQQQRTDNNHNYNNNQHQNVERTKGAPGHDIENCYQLNFEVQKLIKSGMVSFEDRAPNVKLNPLPTHGNASINMEDGYPSNFRIFDVRHIRQSLVEILRTLYLISDCEHDHDGCVICNVNPRGCVIVKRDIQKIENGQQVPLPAANSIVSIADVIKVTRSGCVFSPVSPKVVEDVVVGKKADIPVSGKSSGLKVKDDDIDDEKIYVLYLLMNSEAHREALRKVLEQAYVEHDVTVDQFNHIIVNITSCNNLSFCDEELPNERKNHNMALHISMNCKEDDLSNVLEDTTLSLNVLLKSTLARLSYQAAPMRYNNVVVKEFNASRKTLIGEVDLPVKISLSEFQITFQVMDIHPAYSCLLGRPWIHEVGAVTSTLHPKLKLVKNGGEKGLLVSHLSSFTYVQTEKEVGTPFQALSVADEVHKIGASMSSLKDAREVVQVGGTDRLGRVIEVIENKNKVGLGF